jgi:putative membrane protein
LLSWFAVPLITTIVLLFLDRKMAIHLQDPFEKNKPTDTPVTAIANTIEQNLIQMVNEYRNEFENHDIIVDNKELITVKLRSTFIINTTFRTLLPLFSII